MNKKKNILLFIDWFLPGTASGGPVRSITNMIQQMAEETNFYIVTRDSDYVSNIPYTNILRGEWNVLFNNAKVFYLSEEKLTLKTYRGLINTLDVDCIYVNGIYSFKFSILPLIALRNNKSRIVVGARGMLNPQAFTVKGFKKRVFLIISKTLNLYKKIVFHATNDDELYHIKNVLGGNVKVAVAPNFPRRINKDSNPTRGKDVGELKLVNVARISKEKGTLYIFDYLRKLEGKISLDIYGPIYDSEYWDACKEQIQNLPNNIKVNYKGVVDGSDVPKILTNYQFFIMPTEGENYGHSILEALSAGLPVIISDLTPWKNLRNKKIGWDISLHKTDEFIKTLEELIAMDNHTYNEWSESAFAYAITIINDKEVIQSNMKMLFG